MVYQDDMNAIVIKEQLILVSTNSKGQPEVVLPPYSGKSVVPVTEPVS